MGWQTIAVTACTEIDLFEILSLIRFIIVVFNSLEFGIKKKCQNLDSQSYK